MPVITDENRGEAPAADDDIIAEMRDGERPTHVIFGGWGYGGGGVDYDDDDDVPAPRPPCGVPMTWDDALPFLRSWSIYGGYGAPEVYAITVWTNERVLFIHEYDGATRLDFVERNPVPHFPTLH